MINRILLSFVFLFVFSLSFAQLATWNETCDGDAVSSSVPDVTASAASVATSGSCAIACFSGQEGAVRVIQAENATSTGTFEFPLTFDEDGEITALELRVQRSGSGYQDFEVFIDGVSYHTENWTGTSEKTVSIDVNPDISYSSGTTVTVSVEAENGSSGTSSCASAGSFRVPRMIILGSILPVELASFNVQQRGKMAFLDWVTESEINNEGFEVQRSTDGRYFETLTWVEGHGTSHVLNEYSTEVATVNGMINYYRLKQMDYDGQFEYSPIVVLNAGGDQVWSAYVTDSELKINNASDATFTLTDLQGRKIDQGTVLSQAHYQTFNHKPGMYFLTLENGSKAETIKLYK